MNTQLKKTIEKASPKILHFIDLIEKTYNAQARVSVLKIDRPLLLTRGEITRTINKSGNRLHSICSSIYYALLDNPLGDVLSAIPTDTKSSDDNFQLGTDIIDFLLQMKKDYSHLTLKAIIHVDALETYNYQPDSKTLEWFKIQVYTPKDNKTPDELIDEEMSKRAKLQAVKEMRG